MALYLVPIPMDQPLFVSGARGQGKCRMRSARWDGTTHRQGLSRQEQLWAQHTLTISTADIQQNLPLVSSAYSSLGGSQCPHPVRAHQGPAELIFMFQLMHLPTKAGPEALFPFWTPAKVAGPVWTLPPCC